MKKSTYQLAPRVLSLMFAVGAGWLSQATAQIKPAPERELLPKLDLRAAAPKSPERLAQNNAGLNALKQRLSSANVSFDKLLDSPRFINSRKGFLTGPNGVGLGVSPQAAQAYGESDPNRGVKAFLDDNSALFGHDAAALNTAVVTRESMGKHNGLRTVVWQQQYAGLPVFNAVFLANVTSRGELASLGSHFLPDPAVAAAGVTPAQATLSSAEAVIAALANLGDTVAATEVAVAGATENNYTKLTVGNTTAAGRLVWLPLNRTSLRLAWETVVRSVSSRFLYQVLVDARSGEVLLRRDLMSHISDATYNVYTSDSPSPFSPGWNTPNNGQPPLTNRVLVTQSALDVTASPSGWIDDGVNETQGNNVDAFVDRNFDQAPDGGTRVTGNPNRVFDFPMDLSQEPSTYTNAAVVQLFYYINVWHDRLYQLGFTESAGNFQNNNFGRGGAGNDRVLAYVQAGADVGQANNAAFGTPPDGFSGEMYMFVYNGPNPDRDGDFDADIVYHENSHGLSQRLVGGGVLMDALQSDGMGEGWSDFVGMSLSAEPNDDPDGIYPSAGYAALNLAGLQQNYYFGDRHFPYTTDMAKNPFTFRDIDPTQISPHNGVPRSPLYAFTPLEADEVHHQGEIWCVTLWDVRANLIRRLGFAGNELMLQLVVDGMKLGPANPTFLEARDAILLADLVNNGGVNTSDIWAGFAKRGMGVSAMSPASDTTIGLAEAFDVPGLQINEVILYGGNDNGVIDINECNLLDIVLKNNAAVAATGVSVEISTTTRGVAFGNKNTTYSDVPIGLTATNTIPLSISTAPNFVCGTPIVLSVVIKSDQATSQTTLTFPTGTNGPALRFDSLNPVVIPDNTLVGTNSPVVVSNVTSAIGKVTVSLFLTHSWDADLTLQLISPDGVTTTLSSGNGASGDNYGASCVPEGLRTTFDDDAATPIGSGLAPFIGSYRPQEPLSVYIGKAGTNVNGIWQLRIVDDQGLDFGALNCWSLQLYAAGCLDGGGGCPGADLAVGITDAPDPVFVGSNLVYTITATNFGPSTAKSVVITHQLPPSVVFVSAVSSQGSCVNASGTVVCTLGNLDFDGTATATITVVPTAVGTISSSATITATDVDPDPLNNTATTQTHVNPPTAELSIGLRDLPDPALVGGTLIYTVSVTNGGPSSASSVFVTNTLPPSVVVQSASVTQGITTINGNVVIFNVGSVTNGGRVFGTINVTPLALGNISAVSRVSALQTDPIAGNNIATATTVVGPAADLGIGITDTPDPVVVGNNWTYAIGITNFGPSVANNASLTLSLAAGVSVVSSNTTQGSIGLVGSVLTASLGSLPSGTTATVLVTVNSTNVGDYTAVASIASSANDSNPTNNEATAITGVRQPTVSIVAAGASLLIESVPPANGAIDLGETVTMSFRLLNAGNIPNAEPVTATLLATNGVTAPSSAKNYGILAPGGIPTGQDFTFTAAGTNGGTISPTLFVQYGTNTKVLSFTFNLPTVRTFSNSAPINILDAAAASLYPSTIEVTGVTGQVGRVTARLINLNHSYVEDLDVLLVNPANKKVMLMSDVGSPNGVVDATITFADGAPALPDDGQVVATTYAPADFELGEDLPAPAPANPYPTSLSAFNDAAANGTWSLYIADDSGGDVGTLSGWSLSVTTVTPINQVADVAMSVVATPSSTLVGSLITYTYTVTNSGPSVATGLAFSNQFPADVTVVFANSSHGVVATNGNLVTASLGSLAFNTNTTITVGVIPNVAGLLVTSGKVSASENDLNSANNLGVVNVQVGQPFADIAVIPNVPATAVINSNINFTFTVTNQGPQTALKVTLNDPLPTGFTFVSAAPSSGTVTNTDNNVSVQLGNIAAGSSASVTIVAKAITLGSRTNVAVAATTSTDTNAADNTVSSVIQVVPPLAKIVAFSANLTAESVTPANLAIENGETVTVALSLRNTGSANTANLIATLQASGGVSAPSAPQNYGNIPMGGAPVARSFSFTGSGANGGLVTATLQLNDGANNLGTVQFVFNLPTAASFTNATPIVIPNSGAATPYPSSIEVSGMTGLVSKVTVTLNGLTHGFPDDIDVLLVSPSGQKVVVMSDAGGGNGVTNITLTLDDAFLTLPNSTQISSGSRGPADYEAGDIFPLPAPDGPVTSALASFNGAGANGTWSLYVVDDANGDPGIVANGWTLGVTTVSPVSSVSDLAITVVDDPDPVFAGNPLVYTITVTNRGPLAATGIVVTDDLPAGLNLTSSSASQGTIDVAGPHITANLGNLASGSTAVVTLNAVAAFSGNYTNTVRIIANEADLNLVNNNAAVVTTVISLRPARFSDVIYTNGELQATLSGEPGSAYVIYASDNLTSWTPIATNTIAGNGTSKVIDQNAGTFTNRFYRAVKQTP